ncbi:hypothetical protein [Spirosoma aerophilum]
MTEARNLSYDLSPDDPAPIKGQYLVSIGAKGIGSIYLIRSVRVVQSRIVRPFVRYGLTVVAMPELKPYTEFVRRFNGAQVWVRGIEALPCFWYSRSKKIKK